MAGFPKICSFPICGKGMNTIYGTTRHKAPLFNVTGQKVCLGNAKLSFPDNPTFDNYILYWEKKFWLSEFSHLGGNTNPTKSNLVTVTKNSVKSFDNNELLPFKKDNKTQTLKDLLK
jgi:hypothetical protein